jgi:hypothetical protein
MFRKKPELTEADLVRLALRDKEAKIQVFDKNGRSWILENDTANETKLSILDVKVKDGKDITLSFRVKATNGRMGY